ncbi:PaeR7I family type II restriction endonuclease [Algoriphagus sp. C2-6-M1]
MLVVGAKDLGIPETCIYTKRNNLPEFFRPSKNWDLLIISPKNQLIAFV